MSYKWNVFTSNLDIVGATSSWQSPVANFAALPGSGNSDGDVRLTLDLNDAYRWNSGGSSWQYVGKVKAAAVGSSPSANGFTVGSDNTVTLQPADATHPGVLTTGAQSFAGIKTFSGVVNSDAGVDRSTSGTLAFGVSSNATTINIGNAGATVNIQGTTLYENVSQLQVTDPLITLNKGGGAGSASASGIELEENATPTAYVKTSGDRNSWTLKAPNTAGIATVTAGAGGITLNQSSHDPVTLAAVGSSPNANAASLSSQVLTLQPANNTNPGVLTAGTQTIGGDKTFTGATVTSKNVSITNAVAEGTPGNPTLIATGDPSTKGLVIQGNTNASSRPANSVAYGSFTSSINLDWSQLGGSLTGTATGGAAIVSNELNCNGGGKYVTWSATNNAPFQYIGTIRTGFRPNYSGTPGSNTNIFFVGGTGFSSANAIVLFHDSFGMFNLRVYNSAGSNLLDTQLGAWSPTAGTLYTFELDFNFTAGATRLFVDGIQAGGTQTLTTSSRTQPDIFAVAQDQFASGNGSYKDLITFSTVQHTSNHSGELPYVYGGLQTADLFEIQSAASTVLAAIDHNGEFSAASVTPNNLTANTVPYADSNKKLVSSSVTPTQLGFLSGASSTTGTGNLVFSSAPTLTNPVVGTQTQGDTSTKAASTAYVDTAVTNAIAAVNPAVAVKAATTSASNTTGFIYVNGVGGIGATYTSPSNNTAFTVDGVTFDTVGQRVLIKDDATPARNGIYFISQLQGVALPVVLTRALDFDQPSDINNTGAIPVLSGAVNGTTQWVVSSLVTTVGTDAITFTKFSRNPADYILKSSGDINETSFSAANNQASAANVTGLAFANGTVRSFEALVSVYVNATSSLYEVFTLRSIQKGASWDLAVTSNGDASGFVFSITNAGQVQYVDSNYSGFVAATVKFRAISTSV